MDHNVINRKLNSLARCVRRIETKRPQTPEQWVSDIDLQDILSLNIERAVQLCVDIGQQPTDTTLWTYASQRD